MTRYFVTPAWISSSRSETGRRRQNRAQGGFALRENVETLGGADALGHERTNEDRPAGADGDQKRSERGEATKARDVSGHFCTVKRALNSTPLIPSGMDMGRAASTALPPLRPNMTRTDGD